MKKKTIFAIIAGALVVGVIITLFAVLPGQYMWDDDNGGESTTTPTTTPTNGGTTPPLDDDIPTIELEYEGETLEAGELKPLELVPHKLFVFNVIIEDEHLVPVNVIQGQTMLYFTVTATDDVSSVTQQNTYQYPGAELRNYAVVNEESNINGFYTHVEFGLAGQEFDYGYLYTYSLVITDHYDTSATYLFDFRVASEPDYVIVNSPVVGDSFEDTIPIDINIRGGDCVSEAIVQISFEGETFTNLNLTKIDTDHWSCIWILSDYTFYTGRYHLDIITQWRYAPTDTTYQTLIFPGVASVFFNVTDGSADGGDGTSGPPYTIGLNSLWFISFFVIGLTSFVLFRRKKHISI